MQNSLFRRRLAIRACFDILLECEAVPIPQTTNDMTTSLISHEMFAFI